MDETLYNALQQETLSAGAASSLTPKNKKEKSFVRELIEFLVIALVIIVPVRAYVAQPFVVSGQSMDPTFATSDYLIINELSYHFTDPSRGDVVVLRYPEDPSEFFIKRVIGLPGETISITHTAVTILNELHPEGVVLDEPYLVHTGNGLNQRVVLGEDEYFVMGDNRPHSSDSRIWGILPRSHIIGTPLVRLLPVTSLSYKPGHHEFTQ